MEEADPLISKEIGLLLSRHIEAGGVQQHRITQLVALPGYTGGTLDGGVCRGATSVRTERAPLSSEVENPEHRKAELRPRLPEEDEEVSDEVARLDDFVNGID